ncbi:MAG: SPOR domain-containing protein [Magnetococcales bacterium]|nr:SPOR domain-containing protein [Magnetococcales bacterium]
MKASPNREQQLFLITGGVILLLILAVVIFNMVRYPAERITDEVPVRPVVKLTDSSGRISGQYPRIGPAPVFSNHGNEPEISTEQIINQAVIKPGQQAEMAMNSNPEHILGGETPDERLTGGWNRSPGSLEAARQENSLKLAQKKAAETPKIPTLSVKRDQNKPSKNAEPVTDFSQAIADMMNKKKQAQAVVPPQQTVDKPVAVLPAPQPAPPPIQIIKSAPAVSPAPVLAQPEPEPTPAQITTNNGYSVQVASFSSSERADAMQNKLNAYMLDGRRVPVYQGQAVVQGKTYYRVRLGPFSSLDKAHRANSLIKSKAGISGQIINPTGQ